MELTGIVLKMVVYKISGAANLEQPKEPSMVESSSLSQIFTKEVKKHILPDDASKIISKFAIFSFSCVFKLYCSLLSRSIPVISFFTLVYLLTTYFWIFSYCKWSKSKQSSFEDFAPFLSSEEYLNIEIYNFAFICHR